VKGQARVRIDGPQVLLKPDVARAVAVALHELATNAAKYGALSVDAGRIELNWSHEADDKLILRWTEMDGPAVQAPTHHGFGGRVIKGMISLLKGKASFDWRPEGLVCEMTIQA
jgi:two-component sensor histidine kinase